MSGLQTNSNKQTARPFADRNDRRGARGAMQND
jgi:hypothetical protein